MTWKDLSVDKKPSKLWIGRIFHFGKFVFGTNLISVIYNSLDKLLIGALLSPMQVAYANTASKVLNLIEVPVFAITSISLPKAASLNPTSDKMEIKAIYEKSIGAMLALSLPLVIVCLIFSKEII